MILNHLKLALRLLIRSPFLSFINVLGLSVGFAVFIVLWQYTRQELASEQFIQDHQRIVRFGIVWNQLNKEERWNREVMATSHPEVTRMVAFGFAEIESYTRVFCQPDFTRAAMPHGRDFTVSFFNTAGEKTLFKGAHFAYADPNLFSFFGLPMVYGNAQAALAEPGSLVVSEDFAMRHFGHASPVGRSLFIHDTIAFHITGVFKNLPANTHMKFEAVASAAGIKKNIEVIPFTADAYAYFKLGPGADRAALEKKLNGFNNQYWQPVVSASGFNISRVKLESHLQPLADIPFSKLSGDHHLPKSRETLRFLHAVPFIILAMALVNYMNLVLAAHGKRMKELIARKNAGASAFDFLRQFVLESLLTNMLACLLALIFIQLSKYPLQQYFHFYLPSWNEITWPAVLVFVLILLAGVVVPAVYLALVTLRRTPHTLMTSTKLKNNETVFGKALTIFQYTSAIVLIVYAFAVYRQLNFVLSDSMGVDKRDVVVVDSPTHADPGALDFFIRQCEKLAGVDGLATSTHVTGDDGWSVVVFQKQDDDRNFLAHTTGGVDTGFIPFYGIELLAGRNFSAEAVGDSNAIIVSEEMVKFLALPGASEAIGKTIDVWTRRGEKMEEATIIGIIKGFEEKTLFKRGGAGEGNSALGDNRIILTFGNSLVAGLQPRKISMRIRHENLQGTMAAVERHFIRLFPDQILQWNFLEDHMNRHYSYERVTRNQIIVFSGLAVLIACLGLLGTIDNKVLAKQREIVIRKVFGARATDIGGILLQATVLRLFFSVAVGLPLAVYPVRQYLEKFEKHFSFEWWHYAIPVLILIVILFASVTSVLLNAIRRNPVELLRRE